MQRKLLEYQANQIEMVLSSHKIASRVLGGIVTPRAVRFQVATRMGTRLSAIQSLSEELALSLNAPSCRVVRQNGALNIEVPRSEPAKVSLLDVCERLAYCPPCAPVLGMDDTGAPLLLNLPSPDVAHVLISGTTGSGKTALARSMALSLAMHNPQRTLQLLLIDPKGRGLTPLAPLPHLLCPPITAVEQAKERLQWLVKEMERRDDQHTSSPCLIVFVDELADLLLTGGKELEYAVTRLSQRGREAGIHLVVCTQKPTVAVLGSLTKANFPVRLVGSVTSSEEARLAAGIAGTGAERLQGRGDFVLVAKGEITRFSAAYVSSQEAQQACSGLCNQHRCGASTREMPMAKAASSLGGLMAGAAASGSQLLHRLTGETLRQKASW